MAALQIMERKLVFIESKGALCGAGQPVTH